MALTTREIGDCPLAAVATSHDQMLFGTLGRAPTGNPHGRMEQHSGSTLAMDGERPTGPNVSKMHIRMESVHSDPRRHKTGVHLQNKWHKSDDTSPRMQASRRDWKRNAMQSHQTEHLDTTSTHAADTTTASHNSSGAFAATATRSRMGSGGSEAIPGL